MTYESDKPAPTVREFIYYNTHGDPPVRGCLTGSDEKWDGYTLGVEEAICAAEEWLRLGANPR